MLVKSSSCLITEFDCTRTWQNFTEGVTNVMEKNWELFQQRTSSKLRCSDYVFRVFPSRSENTDDDMTWQCPSSSLYLRRSSFAKISIHFEYYFRKGLKWIFLYKKSFLVFDKLSILRSFLHRIWILTILTLVWTKLGPF